MGSHFRVLTQKEGSGEPSVKLAWAQLQWHKWEDAAACGRGLTGGPGCWLCGPSCPGGWPVGLPHSEVRSCHRYLSFSLSLPPSEMSGMQVGLILTKVTFVPGGLRIALDTPRKWLSPLRRGS